MRQHPPNKASQLFREFSWKLLFYFISLLLIVKDRLVEMFLRWYFGEKKTCPALSEQHQFLKKSATELAAAIRNGEITSTQLVTATLERMREVNGLLNGKLSNFQCKWKSEKRQQINAQFLFVRTAIADGPFASEALDEAKAIDERIANKQISNGN